MKKLILLTLICFATAASAQEISKHALGVRLGDNDGFGTEINYQLGIAETNRLEFGLGWRTRDNVNAMKATGLFQWVFPLDASFHWYAGAGGGLGRVSFDSDFVGDPDDETFLFAAGAIGIEYNFKIPILISFDFRPEIGFGDFSDDVDFELALGIRYQFN